MRNDLQRVASGVSKSNVATKSSVRLTFCSFKMSFHEMRRILLELQRKGFRMAA